MRHYMLDLETMSTRPDGAIVAIGAVRFDAADLHEEFYINIDLQSCLDAGLKIDAGTVMWWLKQGDQARAALAQNPQHLNVALLEFSKYLHDGLNPTKDLMANIRVWGNGSDFDNAMLANAYRASLLDQPWPFWGNRCFRTLKSEFDLVGAEMHTRIGTHHQALDDAKHQARHLQAIVRKYNLPLLS